MKLKPRTNYTYHQDYTKRFHIPLITNDNCFFVVDDKIVRYPADGNYYIVDTEHKSLKAGKYDTFLHKKAWILYSKFITG